MGHRPLAALLASSLAAAAAAQPSGIFLPGTQPGENDIEFGRVDQCLMCHSQTPNGDADPYFSWAGGMMAHSARDPVFRAALAVANQDVAGIGEWCFRCHAPRGWLEGRATPDGSSLTREDLNGISCEVCHRFVDPLSDEAAGMVQHQPPGYGNGMLVADATNIVRGPYGDGTGAMPHRVMKSPFHAASELCAPCHTVSNPLLAEDPTTQPPHEYGHIDRTYSEWLLSDFPSRGREGTCQACHYPAVEGGGQASRFGSPKREHFATHGPVGGSTWVQDATFLAWDGRGMVPKALEAGKQRARELLKTAATLELTFPETGRAVLRVTNNTGHKLPSGAPEGRRMWVSAAFLGADGAVLGEIGRYGERTADLGEMVVNVPTLLDPDRTRVYECLPGMSPEQAARHGKTPGKSFHLVLNDMTVKDNRIPPAGFSNARYAEHGCAPVAATYADGQHWDDVPLDLPEGTATVRVRLMYQSVSWEYIRFLAEENRTDDWGRKLYDLWTRTDRCPPEVIAEITKAAP
jgi:hypothetical protein